MQKIAALLLVTALCGCQITETPIDNNFPPAEASNNCSIDQDCLAFTSCMISDNDKCQNQPTCDKGSCTCQETCSE